MPNHVHFVAVTVGADLRVRPVDWADTWADTQVCPYNDNGNGRTLVSAPILIA